MTGLTKPHPYPGKLIIVEGIDGSGKSTQIALLHRWLLAQGQNVFFTEWNSSALVRRSLRRGKKKDLLTPTTFFVLVISLITNVVVIAVVASLVAQSDLVLISAGKAGWLAVASVAMGWPAFLLLLFLSYRYVPRRLAQLGAPPRPEADAS